MVERTGRNPQYEYLQLGCSRNAAAKMLAYAKRCVGKPFSNVGMARSLFWPRQTDSTSFFCAELVAALLKEGGLMDGASNPGEATPQMLYAIYKPRAAAAANPFVLRDVQSANQTLDFRTTVGGRPTGTNPNPNHGVGAHPAPRSGDETPYHAPPHPTTYAEREALLQQRAIMASVPAPVALVGSSSRDRRRGDSPPKQAFRIIAPGHRTAVPTNAAQTAPRGRGYAPSGGSAQGCRTGLTLTLNSLDMSRKR